MSDFCSVFTLLPFISHWSNHVTVSTLKKKKSFSKAGLWLVINRTTVRVNRSASQGGTTSSNRLIILFRSWILTRECFIQQQRNRTQNNINKAKIYKSQTLCVCVCVCVEPERSTSQSCTSHPGCTLIAASTAFRTSFRPPSGQYPSTLPPPGGCTATLQPDSALHAFPPTKCE